MALLLWWARQVPGPAPPDPIPGEEAVLCWACRLCARASQPESCATCLLLQHQAELDFLSACSPVIHTATFGPLQPGVTYFYQASLSQLLQACAQLPIGLGFLSE